MSNTYTTRQGESVDLACLAHYGRTDNVASLGVVLPMGTKIIMPIQSTATTQPRLVSLWD